MKAILIVGGNHGFHSQLEAELVNENCSVETGTSVQDALALAERREFGVVVTALLLPDGDGLQVWQWFHEHYPETSVLLIAPSDQTSRLAEVVKAGLQRPASTEAAAPLTWREIERRAIERALRETGGNRTHAARRLGISLRKLQYRLKEYGLPNAGPTR